MVVDDVAQLGGQGYEVADFRNLRLFHFPNVAIIIGIRRRIAVGTVLAGPNR